MRIPLGTIVRDRVTGFIGVAENRASYLYGVDRYHVQPQVNKKGKVPDGYMVDEPQLETVEGMLLVMSPPEDPPIIVELGSLVNDPVRGMNGTASGRAVYLNGCARIWVEPKQIAGKDHIKSWWASEGQLTVIEQGHQKVDEIKNTGGPAPSSSKY